MAHIRKLVAALVIAGGAGTVSAGPPPLKSAGAQFCSAALSADGRIDPAAVQWTIGYLSGRISADGPVPKHRPFGGPDGIRARLIAYCRANSHWQVADGAASFFP